MANTSRKTNRPAVLSGWKEIAVYLGNGVRTVQRYEQVFGLPVHRPAGKPHAAVITTKAELDAWVAAGPILRPIQKPQKTLDMAGLRELKAQIEELRRLTLESQALRETLRETLDVLRRNLALSLDARFQKPSEKIH